jgi:hypothetical protein
MVATVQGAYFFRNRVRSIPMYIGMSNDFYRPTKIASCAPGFLTIGYAQTRPNSMYFSGIRKESYRLTFTADWKRETSNRILRSTVSCSKLGNL